MQWIGCGLHAPVGFACMSHFKPRRRPVVLSSGGSSNHIPPPSASQPDPKRPRCANSNVVSFNIPPGEQWNSNTTQGSDALCRGIKRDRGTECVASASSSSQSIQLGLSLLGTIRLSCLCQVLLGTGALNALPLPISVGVDACPRPGASKRTLLM